SGSCAGIHPAPNGTYTVTLRSGLLLQHKRDQQAFRLKVPPQTPAGVRARRAGPRQVLLRWKKGSAGDLASYDVLSASGRLLAKRLPVSHTCHGGECAAVLDVSPDNAGQKVGFRVRARRHTAPGSAATIASGPSSVASVVLPDPPSAKPRITHTQGVPPPPSGSTPMSPPSIGNPHPTLPDGLARPKIDLPKLRPLASTSALKLPDVAKNSNDVFKPRLTYPTPKLPQASPASSSGQPRAQASDEQAAVLQATDWWKSVALGLVLLLVAAHLGAWSWRVRPAPAKASSRRAKAGVATADTAESAQVGRTGGPFGAYHGRRRR
ncbi:MAG: hypothetical protein ACRDN9_12995, partial [Streptosporangiaceae bacterium]